MPIIRTILHPTDLSENSQPAFQLACALARDYGAELIVLHVYPPPFNEAEAVDRGRNGDIEGGLLEQLRGLVPPDKSIAVDYRVAEGSPAEVIVESAAGCDLVVMGTHGRTGLRRILMGSVAEKVLRDSPCPVVSVRPAAHLPEERADSRANATKGGQAAPNADLGGGD